MKKEELCFGAGAHGWMCSPVLSSPSRTLGPVNRDGMENVECGVRLQGDT